LCARHASVLSTGSDNYFAKVSHDLATGDRSIRDPLHFPSGQRATRHGRIDRLGTHENEQKSDIFVDNIARYSVATFDSENEVENVHPSKRKWIEMDRDGFVSNPDSDLLNPFLSN